MKWEGHYEATDIGYISHLFGKTPIMRVVLNKDFPLCYTARNGIRYRPDVVFSSDGGSIPDIIQRLPIPFITLRRDVYKRAYFVHDSAYQQHGLWTWTGDRWTFTPLDRGRVDALLYESLLADGANHVEASIIYAGVRAGGWVPWNKRAGESQ